MQELVLRMTRGRMVTPVMMFPSGLGQRLGRELWKELAAVDSELAEQLLVAWQEGQRHGSQS